MSEIKVSQMPEASNINDNDLLMIIQGGYNKKISKELLGIPTKAHQINVGEDTDYKVNLLKTKNLFDKNSIVGGYRIGQQGNYNLDASYFASVFIKIKPNTSYTISKAGAGQYSCYATYQADKSVIARSSFISGTSVTFTTPADCYYLVVCDVWANLDTFQLEEGSTATPYKSFVKNQINVDNEKYSDTINVGATEDSRSRVNVLKSHNKLPNLSVSGTTNGVTWAIEGNKLTLNGTASADSTIYLYGSWGNEVALERLKAGAYNFNVSGATAYNKLALWLITRASGTTSYLAQLQKTNEDGNVAFTINDEKPITGFYISFSNGVIFNNETFNLQVNKGNTALDFEPYVVPSIKVNGDEILIPQATEWMTLNSNFGVYYRKVGFNVEIRMNKGQTAQSITSSPTTLGTLPSGFEPKENIFMPVANETAPSVRLLVLNTGVVQIQALGGGTVSLGYAGTYITYSTL